MSKKKDNNKNKDLSAGVSSSWMCVNPIQIPACGDRGALRAVYPPPPPPVTTVPQGVVNTYTKSVAEGPSASSSCSTSEVTTFNYNKEQKEEDHLESKEVPLSTSMPALEQSNDNDNHATLTNVDKCSLNEQNSHNSDDDNDNHDYFPNIELVDSLSTVTIVLNNSHSVANDVPLPPPRPPDTPPRRIIHFSPKQQHKRPPLSPPLSPSRPIPSSSATGGKTGSRTTLIMTLFHLSTFGILGSITRIIFTELFNSSDCHPSSSSMNVIPSLCVTNNSSALFLALPANMLGSFLMGLLATGSSLAFDSNTDNKPIAILPSSHYFQSLKIMQLGLRTGFCGCLTTFASWNAQLVMMLDGTALDQGGQPRVAQALMGYVVGLQVAVASLVMGRDVARWIHQWLERRMENNEIKAHQTARDLEAGKYDDHDDSQPMKKGQQLLTLCSTFDTAEQRTEWDASTLNHVVNNISADHQSPLTFGKCLIALTPSVIVITLLTLFVCNDIYHSSRGNYDKFSFYRTIWMSCVMTPPGVILRWKLSQFNNKINTTHCCKYLRLFPSWIPLGTLAANILGSMVSITAVAVMTRYDGDIDDMARQALAGVAAGFAGSLSTVSTFVNELDVIRRNGDNSGNGYKYGVGSLMTACALSLVIYCPIVRSF